MAEALLHLSRTGDELYGAWVSHGGQLESYYPDGDESPERPWAEEVITARGWESAVESLPRSAPYIAWWEPIEQRPNETAEAVFKRAKSAFNL